MPQQSMIEPSRMMSRKHCARLCAKGHANTDLACPSRNRICFDSVETNDRQAERQPAKDGKQCRPGAHNPEFQIRIEMLSECF